MAYPNESMQVVLRRLGARDVGRVPVIASEESRQLLGLVRRRDILSAYSHSISKRAYKQHKAVLLSQGSMENTSLLCVRIPPDAKVVGERVSAIGLPENCIIVSLRRGSKFYMPKGDTVLYSGDMLELYGLANKLQEGVIRLTEKEENGGSA